MLGVGASHRTKPAQWPAACFSAKLMTMLKIDSEAGNSETLSNTKNAKWHCKHEMQGHAAPLSDC